MERMVVQVSGQVQGVGFRYYTQLKALELGLVGHAKNLASGDVEVLAEGSASALSELVDWLHQGSPLAQVEQLALLEREEDVEPSCSSFKTY